MKPPPEFELGQRCLLVQNGQGFACTVAGKGTMDVPNRKNISIFLVRLDSGEYRWLDGLINNWCLERL